MLFQQRYKLFLLSSIIIVAVAVQRPIDSDPSSQALRTGTDNKSTKFKIFSQKQLQHTSLPASNILLVAESQIVSNEPIAVSDEEDWAHTPDHDLVDNWNLIGSGLRETDIVPYVSLTQPRSIIFYDSSGMKKILPMSAVSAEQQSDQILFMGTAESVRQTIIERNKRASENDQNLKSDEDLSENINATNPPVGMAAENTKKNDTKKLSQRAFEIVFFKPGKRDDGKILKPTAVSLIQSLQGPDYSLESFDWRDEELMRKHLSTILSLGHGGEIMIRVQGGGVIRNEKGFDFALFENAFRPDEDLPMQQEFGEVGVSESDVPSSFSWFPCRPQSNILRGCFGAVPTAEGGDQFDLGELGLSKVRYIWIKDIGVNKNSPSKWPTEGCDLDAVRLYHAYTN